VTGVRELVQVRVVSAAPEQVRLSVLGGRTQLDVSLPLDAPIASLVPELVKLVRSRDTAAEPAEDAPSKEAKRNFWELSRADDDEPLSPDVTLREAGVTSGSLLRLSAERALSAPTLYDDVVDAAARLNRAAYAGWDATAAGWVALAGVHLASLVWVYFLISDVLRPHRPALAGVAIVVALSLVGVAALAERSYALSRTGAALGWAAIPITASITWALLSGWGGYGLAAGCAGLIVVLYGFYRTIGTGHWGFLASGVFFGLAGVALAVHEVGVRADWVGSGLAVAATLLCQAVPRLTAPIGRFKPPRVPVEPSPDATMFENPFTTPTTTSAADPEAPAQATPTAEGVWERVRSATLTRSALYAGLATGAVVGAVVVMRSQIPLHWSGLTFALVCAAALGLYTRRPTTPIERASFAAPSLALGAYACWIAQAGDQPMPIVAFGLLLLAAVAFAVVGSKTSDGRPSSRTTTLLAYLEYLASVALIPLALWVAGLYGRLGI
jgi:type VII secretion integral membrane protein EccD